MDLSRVLVLREELESNYIKDSVETILVPLRPEYRYYHGPLEFGLTESLYARRRHIRKKNHLVENEYSRNDFIGRTRIVADIQRLLIETKNNRGCYLIAGYRGIGKTSVINRAIAGYKCQLKEKKEFNPIVVRVNLGHRSSFRAKDIYYNLITLLCLELRKTYNKLQPDLLRNGLSVLSANIQSTLGFTHFRRFLAELEGFQERIGYSINEESKITLGLPEKFEHYKWNTNWSWSKSRKSLPLDEREIELQLIHFLERAKNLRGFKPDIIFVFDEIDKVSSHDAEDITQLGQELQTSFDKGIRRKQKLDILLGSLKNLVTTAKARFIFVAGREAIDGYYSETGSTSSLYESIFDQVYEIPSLLTDPSDGKTTILASMIEVFVCQRLHYFKGCRSKNIYEDERLRNVYQRYCKKQLYKLSGSNPNKKTSEENARYVIYILRSFINYLAFQSWGNPKRLTSLFESFITPVKYTINGESFYCLKFEPKDQKRFLLSSSIFSLFQHHLSRQVTNISDKLTVSSLSALHFILKFHKVGFTREALYRMDETMSTHRDPELNYVIDSIVTQILRSYLRRVRNGAVRYRFNSGFEQELNYVCLTSSVESASYNFSLDTMNNVKTSMDAHYQRVCKRANPDNVNLAKLGMALGDIHCLEQGYEQASDYYGEALSRLEKTVAEFQNNCSNESLLLYFEILLKTADMEEHRDNYNRAAAIYLQAVKKLDQLKKLRKKCAHVNSIFECLRRGDSKWEILKMPTWCYYYLELKRSSTIKDTIKPNDVYCAEDDLRFKFKKGVLDFYHVRFTFSLSSFKSIIDTIRNSEKDITQKERYAYLKGYSMVNAVDTILCHRAKVDLESLLAEENPEYMSGCRLVRKSIKKFVLSDGTDLANVEDVGFGECVTLLTRAANVFQQAGLHNHASLAYMRIIGYSAMLLDYFDKNSSVDNKILLEKLKTLVNLDDVFKKGMHEVNASREINSAHLVNTWLTRDIGDAKFSSQIATTSYLKDTEQLEKPFWHQSLNGQRLITQALWHNHIKRKLASGNTSTALRQRNILPHSTRFQIFLRWLIARQQFYHLDSIYIEKERRINKFIDLYKKSPSNFQKTADYTEMMASTDFDEDNLAKHEKLISDSMYRATVDHKQLTRNHQELMYPLMSQLCYLQWKLLYRMVVHQKRMSAILGEIWDLKTTVKTVKSRLLGGNLLNGDIPPSHCDLFQMYEKATYYLNNTESVLDVTSRARKHLLQGRYYFHDDFSDAEFQYEWTLLHMFVPNSHLLWLRVSKSMNELEPATTENKALSSSLPV